VYKNNESHVRTLYKLSNGTGDEKWKFLNRTKRQPQKVWRWHVKECSRHQ